MTAGQRNCHIALTHLRDSYGEADITFALRELLMERAKAQPKEAEMLRRFAGDLKDLRVYLETII